MLSGAGRRLELSPTVEGLAFCVLAACPGKVFDGPFEGLNDVAIEILSTNKVVSRDDKGGWTFSWCWGRGSKSKVSCRRNHSKEKGDNEVFDHCFVYLFVVVPEEALYCGRYR